MGLASVWAEYGPARNERARGQNSINRRLKSLPNPKGYVQFILTYRFREIFSLTSERHSH